MHNLTLYIPGLLAPARDMIEADIPDVPSLKHLFAIGSCKPLKPLNFTGSVCRLFGLEKEQDEDLPVAAITRLIDDEHSLEGFWMRADPVHLAADSNGLVLMDETGFNLEQREALVLAADIRELLEAYNCSLEVPTIYRWYIQCHRLPEVLTTPIHDVAGRDIHRFVPVGSRKGDWAKLINEIQMIFHNSRINIDRTQRNELPINSIWFWGGGKLPSIKRCDWSHVISDDVLTHGLSKLAGIPWTEMTESFDDIVHKIEDPRSVLVVISFGLRHSQYHDIQGWQDFISYLEQYWFTGLLQYMRQGEIGQVNIHTRHQIITVNKISLYKFWKRPQSIRAYTGNR